MIGTGSSSDIVYLPTIAIRAPCGTPALAIAPRVTSAIRSSPSAWTALRPGQMSNPAPRTHTSADAIASAATTPDSMRHLQAGAAPRRPTTASIASGPRNSESFHVQRSPSAAGMRSTRAGNVAIARTPMMPAERTIQRRPARARREEPGPREPRREEHALPDAGHPAPEPERAVPREVPRERAAEYGAERLPPSRRELDRPTAVHPVRGRVRRGDVQEERRHEEGALREPECNERGPGALRAQGDHKAAQACHPDHVHLRVRGHPERSARRDERELLAERPTLPSGQVAQKEEPGCEEPWIAREVVVPVHPEQERSRLSNREERPRSPSRPARRVGAGGERRRAPRPRGGARRSRRAARAGGR